MMKPEWKRLDAGNNEVYWCRGCGCVKIVQVGKKTKYATPRREKERRANKKRLNR